MNQSIDSKMQVHEELAYLRTGCDIMIAESSYRSIALRQEIAHAFRIGKPVLALYTDKQLPHFILSDAGDKLLVGDSGIP